MKRYMPQFFLAGVFAVGLASCAVDDTAYTREPANPAPVRPVVLLPPAPAQPSSTLIDGQVVRIDDNSYIIRDQSGRQTRIFFDRNTVRDNIAMGDWVTARYDGQPLSASATSISRRDSFRSPPPPSAPLALSRPQTVEGIVEQQYGNEYVVRDFSGKRWHLWADSLTRRDRNITIGDRVVAVLGTGALGSGMLGTIPMENQPLTSMYRQGDPNIVEGEVIWTDGNSYVVRDLKSGKDVRLFANSSTIGDEHIVVGDRVIAYTAQASGAEPLDSLHVDSLTRR